MGQLDGGAGVGGVAVGADFVGKLLRDRGAADDDAEVGDAGGFEHAHGFLHGGHGGGEQGGEADEAGLVFERGGEVALGADVGAEIDHGETGAAPHHRDQILADVVEIALHGADDDGVFGFDAGRDEQRLEDLERLFHGAGGDQHLGHEDFVAFELFADDRHPGHEGALDE